MSLLVGVRTSMRRTAAATSKRLNNTSAFSSSGVGVAQRRGMKSLAFTTYFKHPDFGMNDYEYLSRSTAFLLAVDPPDPSADGPYGHLEAAEVQRKIRDFKREKGFTPATGPGGTAEDMGWLQFVPREHRPNVHVVCSSHVVSPFLWLDYYPHDWLTQVRQEHCKYQLEVYDSQNPEQSIGSYELHNSPIHHPEGRDIALLHLKDEETALKEMKRFGVDMLHLRDPEKLYKKGETLFFEGFVVHEPTGADSDVKENGDDPLFDDDETPINEDTRVFEPYEDIGSLAFHTNDRFFAETPLPLPEGLCGAPVVDGDGELCGIVEGIVPTTHENKKIAGNAAFLPSFVMAAFVDYVERFLVEQMMPKDIFQQVVRAKATNSLGGGVFKLDQDGNPDEHSWDEAYERQVEQLKKKYSKEEVDAILWNVKREREEVLEIMNKEGGDMDEIMSRVRAKTLAVREKVMEEYKKGNFPDDADSGTGGSGDKKS